MSATEALRESLTTSGASTREANTETWPTQKVSNLPLRIFNPSLIRLSYKWFGRAFTLSPVDYTGLGVSASARRPLASHPRLLALACAGGSLFRDITPRVAVASSRAGYYRILELSARLELAT